MLYPSADGNDLNVRRTEMVKNGDFWSITSRGIFGGPRLLLRRKMPVRNILSACKAFKIGLYLKVARLAILLAAETTSNITVVHTRSNFTLQAMSKNYFYQAKIIA